LFSYIAKIDDNGKLTIYDLNGNEVNLNVNGKYRINVVAHGSEMVAIGAEQLAAHITDLQTKLRIEQTEQGSFSFLTHSSFICIPAINGLGASCFHRLSAISIDFYLCCSAGYFGVDGAITAYKQNLE
jgi:outer membrane protein assembly factor BamB